MLDVKDKSILKYVSDYKLNLIVPEEIEDFDKFKTEMGPLLEFINSAANGKKFSNAFETKRTRWENLSSEAIDLLNICLDAKLEIERDLEKGVGNVCKGLEEFWEMVREDAEKRGLEEGREEGREEGEERLGSLISILCKNHQFDEVQKVASDAELRKKYYLQYNL